MHEARAREVVYELVEAKLDEETMRERLANFNASNEPPRVPSEFSTLQAFLDYYRRKRRYDDELRRLVRQLARAEQAYERAEEALAGVLPENTPLRFVYGGRREELDGTEFRIENRRMGANEREMTISTARRL